MKWTQLERKQLFSTYLKLPSLFAAWLCWTFHNIWHNMKALGILSYNHHFSHLLIYMEKINFCESMCGILEYFHEKKLLPDYPCKSHDYDHKWADLAWLPQNKRKCKHKVVRLVLVWLFIFYSVHTNESTWHWL